jgi:hypothetical protein
MEVAAGVVPLFLDVACSIRTPYSGKSIPTGPKIVLIGRTIKRSEYRKASGFTMGFSALRSWRIFMMNSLIAQ